VPRWDAEWRPEAERRLAPIRSLDLAAASDAGLAEHLGALRDYVIWAHSLHINVHVVCFYVRARWVEVCERLLGLSDFEAYELVQRTDPFHFEGTRRLAAIAARALEDPAVSVALEQPADQALVALRGSWFDTELAAFLEAHGDRAAGFEVDEPTWREQPEVVVSMVKAMMETPYDADAEDAEFESWRNGRIAELRSRLAGEELAEFDHWLALGERAYPLNETHNYLLAELPLGLLRYAALESGRRFAARARVDAAEDAFMLRCEELIGALGGDEDLRAVVAERRAEYERNARLAPPPTLGPPPTEPPYHALPPAVTAAVSAVLSQSQQMATAAPPQSDEHTLAGLPGGPGVAEGPVRLVRALDEFEKVRQGDVIVCAFTNPAWTVLFPRAAALVADSGGPLSHAAIIAREYGLPSVVGTIDATGRLQDGQVVRVDGNEGLVTILTPAGREAVAA
jgi:pyruvate,water dikinase